MKKLINLTGQASPHLSRKITYLMMLLVSLIWSTGTAWAEDFSTGATFNLLSDSYATAKVTSVSPNASLTQNGTAAEYYYSSASSTFTLDLFDGLSFTSGSTASNTKFLESSGFYMGQNASAITINGTTLREGQVITIFYAYNNTTSDNGDHQSPSALSLTNLTGTQTAMNGRTPVSADFTVTTGGQNVIIKRDKARYISKIIIASATVDPTTYTLKAELFGHGKSTDLSWVNNKYSTIPTLGNPTNDTYYDFNGWFTNQACTNAVVEGTPLTAETTLYAKWTKHDPIVAISESTSCYFTSGSLPSNTTNFDWYGAIQSVSNAHTTATAANFNVDKVLKFDSKGSLSFNLAKAATVDLYFADDQNDKSISIDGEKKTIGANGKLSLDLAAGIHTIKRSSDEVYLFYIDIVPVPAYTVTFNSGAFNCGTTELTEASAGAGITLPSATNYTDVPQGTWKNINGNNAVQPTEANAGGSGYYENFVKTTTAAGSQVLYQSFDNLENGTYEVELSVAASYADHSDVAECPTGDGLSVAFALTAAGEKTANIPVLTRKAVETNAHNNITFVVNVTDGNLTFGIKNVKESANWFIAKVVSLRRIANGKFAGWCTTPDGSGEAVGQAGDTYIPTANVTLYPKTAPYIVTFDKNGGSGSMAAQSFTGTATLNNNTFSRAAYDFVGWNTAADGSGRDYVQGEQATFGRDVTLYAQWFRFSKDGSTQTVVDVPHNDYPRVKLITTRNNFTYNENDFEITLSDAETVWARYDAMGTDYLLLYKQAKKVGTARVTVRFKGKEGTLYTARECVLDYTVNAVVTFNTNGGNEIAGQRHAAAFTLPTPTKAGYNFDGWFTDEGLTAPAANPFTPTASTTLYAKWSQNVTPVIDDLVTISEDYRFIPSVTFVKDNLYEGNKLFSAGGNTNGANGLQFKENRAIAFKVNTGAVIKVTAKSNNNSDTRDIQLGTSTSAYTNLATLGVAPGATATLTYTYTGANDGIVYLTSNSELFLKELDIIYSPSYTVTYDLDGGTGAVPTQDAMYEGENFTVASEDGIAKTGYTFDSWSDGENNYSEGDTYTMGASNVTFTAQWTPIQYEVKYKDQGNVSFSGEGGTEGFPTRHNYGTATVLPTPTKVGYVFAGWFTSNDCSGEAISQIDATAITANVTLYAKWVVDGETINYDDDWQTQQSSRHELAAGKSMHITFHNESTGSELWHNWILSAGTDADYNHDYMALRADNYDNYDSGKSTTRVMKQNGEDLDEEMFKADMAAGADVNIDIANSGQKLYVHVTMTAGSNTYDYTAETKTSDNPVYIAMMGELCTLTGIKFSTPATAYSVTANEGEKCAKAIMTNALGMPVSNGTCVPSGEKITFTAAPSDPSYVFEGWKADGEVYDSKNPTTLAVTFPVAVDAVYGEAPTPAVEVTSVLVAGKEYKGTLAGNVFTAGTYYGDPTIEVTLSDGTKPVVTKNNQNNISTTSAATFTSTDGVNYIINYKQKDVTTTALTAVSDKDVTVWDFKTLTRPSSIIGNWTWNNMNIYASETKPIAIGGNNSSFVSNLPAGAREQQSFSIKVAGPGTLTFNADGGGTRNVKIENADGKELGNLTISHVSNSMGDDYSWEYTGSATTLYFYCTTNNNNINRTNSIKWTPAQPVTSIEIPSAVTVHVGEVHRFTADDEIVFKNGEDIVNSSVLANFAKTWTLVDGSSNVELGNKNRTEGKVTGLKSSPSDNLTATVKFAVAGVESNECTVTVVRTPLAVRADHVALSHNGNEARTLKAVAYNPYNRVAVSTNINLTAAIKEGESAFATSTGNTITPTGTVIGTETWTVTATPKSGKAEANLYTAGTADIQVTCRDYLYAYNTSIPATTPTARPVENAAGDVALNYYAGHNPADCKKDAVSAPYATWGTEPRRPQENNMTPVGEKDSNGNLKNPYARISGWDGIKNVAEPTMNSLSEQHTRTNAYGDASNGTFTYRQYSYSGTHDEFNVPVMGSFYRFYPEKNGKLVAYLCVNGQFSDGQMKTIMLDGTTPTGYANRNTYFLDPYAESMTIENATVQPTSTIQPGFFCYTLQNCTGLENFKRDVVELLNNWAVWGNDEKDANGELVIPVKSGSYAAGKTNYTISDVDWTLFKKLGEDKVGIFHQPIANSDGSFRVITKTYVRCEIPVEKGRVYYVSPTGTKTRMAGVEFIPENDPVAVDVNFYNGTLSVANSNTAPYTYTASVNGGSGADAGFDKSMTEGNYYNVTLADRSFKANQWYSFCMPFDVPQKQIHDIFGEDAVTIHFDNVTETTDPDNGKTTLKMNFWSHFYDQIRAGRPIMIKMPATFPNGETTLAAGEVTFQHVMYIPADPSDLFIEDKESGWVFKGSYTPVTMGTNSVILNNQTFYHYKTTAKTLAGNRAWIQGPTGVAPKTLSTSFHFFNEDDEDTATGIEEILSEMGINVVKSSNKIFNLNGQMVGEGADINNLPKGVYIINGKKQIIK